MPAPSTFVKSFHDEDSCARMEYLPLGKTGLNVSKISIGGGTFSHFYGEVDETEAIETIHLALKSGINYIDTAPWYGQGKSEEIYGKALKNIPREAYYIATKVGRYELSFDKMFDFSAKKTRESVENSLKLLGLDYVDIIQIHDIEFAPNLDVVLNETLPELEAIVKEGKAKFIGVTGYPVKILKEIMLAAPGKFDMALTYSRYSLLDNTLEEYMPFFKEHDIGIVCASGHAMGLLTNSGPQAWHPANDDVKAKCMKAAAICKDADIELGKLATYYFMQLDGASTFLIGMQTRKLLEINLNTYHDGLTKKEQEILKLLKETVFTESVNWEGVELEKYWGEMKKMKK